MDQKFDSAAAKKNLYQKEQVRKEEREKDRKSILEKSISILKDTFSGQDVEIFLVGSVVRPYEFHENSDVDIVFKNYQGHRFDIWPDLERQIGRTVEIILYEKCHFQEYVEKNGLKVL